MTKAVGSAQERNLLCCSYSLGTVRTTTNHDEPIEADVGRHLENGVYGGKDNDSTIIGGREKAREDDCADET